MKPVRRFVIQKHVAPELPVHWDFMLEDGCVLKTYRLELPPEELLKKRATAVRIFDHPLKFLTYEGNLSRGKGCVQIADAGTYQLFNQHENRRQIELNGNVLRGKFYLTHLKDDKWEFHLLRAGRSGST